jgi:hypothetical protein
MGLFTHASRKSPLMRQERPMRLPHIVANVSSNFLFFFIPLLSQQHRSLLLLPFLGQDPFVSLHILRFLIDPSSGHRLLNPSCAL